MKEHNKTTKIFWIAAITAIAILFTIMSSALIFTGRVNRQNKLALEKVYQEQAAYRIAESQNDTESLFDEARLSIAQELLLVG